MTVRELIEKLQEIEDQNAEVIISIPPRDPDYISLVPVKNENRNFLIIGTK